MDKTNTQDRRFRRIMLKIGSVAAIAFTAIATAQAGECPAGKSGGDLTKSAPTKPVGVTDTVLRSIDLAKEMVKLNDRQFRIRRLEIQPGGIVPLHQHADRPALIYIIEGSMTEYNSQCSVPVEHTAGEAAMESVGLSHWWKNNGTMAAVLISADILHATMEKGDVM